MRGKTQQNKRRDKGNLVLRKGESQRANGGYDYRWTDQKGKRHSIYAKTLEALREAEQQAVKDQCDGIKTEARNVTVNAMFELWKQIKRGLKDNAYLEVVFVNGRDEHVAAELVNHGVEHVDSEPHRHCLHLAVEHAEGGLLKPQFLFSVIAEGQVIKNNRIVLAVVAGKEVKGSRTSNYTILVSALA